MARAYDMDLRVRVAEAIEAGASTAAAAAARFEIGKATAGAWARLKRATGALTPGRQGKPQGSKLDAHAEFILALVETRARHHAGRDRRAASRRARRVRGRGDNLVFFRPPRNHF